MLKIGSSALHWLSFSSVGDIVSWFLNWYPLFYWFRFQLWLHSGSLEPVGSLCYTLGPWMFRNNIRWAHDILPVLLELTFGALIKFIPVECCFCKVFYLDSSFIKGCNWVANHNLIEVVDTLDNLRRSVEAYACDFNVSHWLCNKRGLIHLSWDVFVKRSVSVQVSAIFMINYNWRHNRALRISCVIHHTFMSGFLSQMLTLHRVAEVLVFDIHVYRFKLFQVFVLKV